MAKSMEQQVKETSVRMPSGGDSHVHTNSDKTVTLTERLPGGYETHYTYDGDGNRKS
jgi:hypothetical protein